MCDYSLYTIQNRLAEEGELVLHQFETGTIGFASASDIESSKCSMGSADGFWLHVKFTCCCCGIGCVFPRYCVPPGAR